MLAATYIHTLVYPSSPETDVPWWLPRALKTVAPCDPGQFSSFELFLRIFGHFLRIFRPPIAFTAVSHRKITFSLVSSLKITSEYLHSTGRATQISSYNGSAANKKFFLKFPCRNKAKSMISREKVPQPKPEFRAEVRERVSRGIDHITQKNFTITSCTYSWLPFHQWTTLDTSTSQTRKHRRNHRWPCHSFNRGNHRIRKRQLDHNICLLRAAVKSTKTFRKELNTPR